MPRRKDPRIPDAVLDQLLAGADPKTVFDPNGLLDDLKKALEERAQGWLKLPNGTAVTGFSHAYKRHGTTTLFAALDVATGLVRTGHYQRRRRIEFLDFMNRVVGETCRPRDPCDLGQSQYPQAQTRPLAGAAQERPLPLYADPCLLAQSSGGLVLRSLRQSLDRREFHLATPGPRSEC